MPAIHTILQIIRWKNTAIVLATLWIIYFALSVDPELCPIFSILHYAILSLALVCVTAAGNIHNDICDVKLDAINRPSKRVVQVKLALTSVWALLITFVSIGALCMSFLAWRFSAHQWLIYYLAFSAILFLYNSRLKCIPILGNLLVATMCSCVVLVPFFLNCDLVQFSAIATSQAIRLLPAFAVFAFGVNLIRELVKDLEDLKGDKQHDCNTFPVQFGEIYTIKFIYVLTLLFIILMFFYLGKLFDHQSIITLGLSLIVVGFPFFKFVSFIKRKNFKNAQNWLKYELVLGLVILLLLSLL